MTELIKSQDSEARDKVEELKKLTGKNACQGHILGIERELSRYDFEGALEELSQMARALNISIG